MRHERAEKDSFPHGFIPEIMSFEVIDCIALKTSSKTVLWIFDLKLSPHRKVSSGLDCIDNFKILGRNL
jgi:hypothetical protein